MEDRLHVHQISGETMTEQPPVLALNGARGHPK